jgi:hypothetical protein
MKQDAAAGFPQPGSPLLRKVFALSTLAVWRLLGTRRKQNGVS